MNDAPLDNAPVELSRLFRLAEFSDSPEHKIAIVTTQAEREALAARYGLISLDALEAQVTVREDPSGEIVAEGHVQAQIVQQCVVTLEPISSTVSASFDQLYTLRPADVEDDLEIGPDDIEPPEPVIGDSIDVGELLAQFLSLSIDPYPRAPDADSQTDQYPSKTPKDGPFAALAQLREPDKN
ncbi:MAG: uncharacterized metal-binding protein YceD (DUF177 family) [Alphaproteobacteria bacterium]|jgi:uncharacterized metal-binding protein YceD (DUF177 family)